MNRKELLRDPHQRWYMLNSYSNQHPWHGDVRRRLDVLRRSSNNLRYTLLCTGALTVRSPVLCHRSLRATWISTSAGTSLCPTCSGSRFTFGLWSKLKMAQLDMHCKGRQAISSSAMGRVPSAINGTKPAQEVQVVHLEIAGETVLPGRPETAYTPIWCHCHRHRAPLESHPLRRTCPAHGGQGMQACRFNRQARPIEEIRLLLGFACGSRWLRSAFAVTTTFCCSVTF